MRIPTFHQFDVQAKQLNKLYGDMNRLYLQSISGERLQASSDDPVLASQIKSTQNIITQLESYTNNNILASHRAELFNRSIQNSIDMVTDVKVQLSKIQTGTTNEKEKAIIASHIEASLSRLISSANTQDANGSYIFSGFSTNIPPYVKNGTTYEYQGGLTPATIDIGEGVTSLYYENGFSVFGDIFTGNGTFTIDAADTNTGSASTTPGAVNPATYVPDVYTLTIIDDGGRKAYQVIGATGGQIIPPLPGAIPADAPTYVPDSDIMFNGISFHIQGDPALGDEFVIQPSTQENVFNVVQSLIDTLNEPVTNKALYDQKISQLSSAFSQISEHFVTYQSHLGTESARIDEQAAFNNNQKVGYDSTLKGLRDVDIISTSTQLAQKSLALQVTQEAYGRLQTMLMELMKLR